MNKIGSDENTKKSKEFVIESSKMDRNFDFKRRIKLFEKAPDTIESLKSERKELHQLLQISRDELDSYIRYMHRVCEEKNQLMEDVNMNKTNTQIFEQKCKRLESLNKVIKQYLTF